MRGFRMRGEGIAAIVLACVIVICGAFSMPVMAQGVQCTIKTTTANLRAWPSTSADRKAVLTQGARVTAHARIPNEGRDWLRVSTASTNSDNNTGYVASELTDDNCNWSALPVEPVPGPQPTAIPTTAPTPTARYQPALDSTGADPDAVRVAGSVGPSVDGVDLFREFLIVKLDPSERAEEFGARVESVDFEVVDDDFNEVYKNTETSAPYCLFKNSDPQACDNLWVFAATNYFWPQAGNSPMRASSHRIDPNMEYRVRIFANYTYPNSDQDNDQDFWEVKIRIIPPNTPARDLFVTESLGGRTGTLGFDNAELRIQMGTLASAEGTPSFRDSMVFRLLVHNGSGRDGDGVGSVRFEIRDAETFERVYVHTELNEPYCVFRNNEDYCDGIWRFRDTDYQWPNSDSGSGVPSGIPLQYNHNYEAVMSVTDSDGNDGGEWSFQFDIVRGR